MTINDWTDLNYPLLSQAIDRITGHDRLSEELLHYTLLSFLDRPDTQTIIDSGGGFYFCLRIATNSWKSTTSPFYRLHRDPNPRQELNPDAIPVQAEEPEPYELPQPLQNPDLHAQIDIELSALGWYEKELTRAYAEHGCNANLLSRVTSIPRTSINLTLKRVRTHIKNAINYE